jgi:hypothetical protein
LIENAPCHFENLNNFWQKQQWNNLQGLAICCKCSLHLKYIVLLQGRTSVLKVSSIWNQFYCEPRYFHIRLLLVCISTSDVGRNTYGSYQSLPWGTSQELNHSCGVLCMAKMRYFRATGMIFPRLPLL